MHPSYFDPMILVKSLKGLFAPFSSHLWVYTTQKSQVAKKAVTASFTLQRDLEWDLSPFMT